MNIKIIWFFTYFIPDKYTNRHSVNDFNKQPFKVWSSVQTTLVDSVRGIDRLDSNIDTVPVRSIDRLDSNIDTVPVRSIDRLDSNVDTVPVRSIGILDSYVDTVSQSQSVYHAGVHYCNSPLKPVTGSEG